MLWSSNSLIYIDVLHLSESAGNMMLKTLWCGKGLEKKPLGSALFWEVPFERSCFQVVRRPLFSHLKSAALGRQEIWFQIYGK